MVMASKKMKSELSYSENLFFGAMGGSMETFIQMPLLTYKVTVQEGRPFPTSLPGWFRGVGAAAASLAPITAVQVSTNGALAKMVTGGTRDTTANEKIMTAMGAGSVSALVYGPVDLLVIQQQKLGKSLTSAISHISKEHGAMMLFRGFQSTVVREAIYTAGYLGIAPVVKEQLMENTGSEWQKYWQENELMAQLVGSCIGGTFAAVVTHPVDTAKTCLQGDMLGTKYRTAREALVIVARERGVGALYAGCSSRVVRLCGAFFIVNNVLDLAGKMKHKYWA